MTNHPSRAQDDIKTADLQDSAKSDSMQDVEQARVAAELAKLEVIFFTQRALLAQRRMNFMSKTVENAVNPVQPRPNITFTSSMPSRYQSAPAPVRYVRNRNRFSFLKKNSLQIG